MAGAQVVQTLMVELDGRTIQLEAKIAQMEKRLQQFEGKAVQGAQTTGKVVGSIGDRYATAARQIAMAGETAARTGQLAGAAGRQLLSQGANMALMFGAKGAIAGGIAITAMAIVEMFTRARREMEETRREFGKEMAQMVRARDFAGVSRRAQFLFSGDPAAELEADEAERRTGGYVVRRHGIQGGRSRLAEIAARRDEISGNVAQATEEGRRNAWELNRLLKERLEILAALPEAERQYAIAIAQTDKLSKDAASKTDFEIRQEAEKKAAAATKDAIAEAKRIREEIGDLLADITGSAADVATRALEKQTDALREAIYANKELSAAEKERLRSTLDSASATKQQTIEVERLVEQLKSTFQQTDASGPTEAAFNRLNMLQLEMLQRQRDVKGNRAAEKIIAEQLLKIDKERARLLGLLGGGKTPATPELSMRETARAIAAAVNGAVELASAFGVMDERSASVLRNVGGIAANLEGALTKGAGQGAAIVGVVGAVAGLLSAAFGDSAADQERRRRLEENTKALRELSGKVGLLGAGLGVSGSGVVAASDALDTFFERYYRTFAQIPYGGPQAALSTLPEADRAMIEDIAKELGITLDGTIASFLALQEAIKQARAKMAEFGNDFEGVNAWLEFERQIFGDQGPLDNLNKLLQQLGGRTTVTRGRDTTTSRAYSPGIEAILAAGDPNTAEGRAAMRKIIERYAEIMRAGGGTLSAELLGGLGGDEFKQAILQIMEYLNALDQGVDGDTRSYSINRQITEVTGDRMAALLTDANFQREQIIALLQQLVGGIIGPIVAPAIAGPSGSGGLAILIDIAPGAFVFQLPGEISAGSAQTLAAAAGNALVKQVLDVLTRELGDSSSPVVRALDTSFAERLRRRSRNLGDNLLPG